MERLKRFPWRRLLAVLVAAVLLTLAAGISRGDKMYVGVDKSNPDAAILSEPDSIFGDPLATLDSNTEVETLGKPKNGYVKIRATVGGKKVEGWFKYLALRKEKLVAESRVSESAGAEHSAQAGKGLTAEIESDMRKNSKNMDTALKRIDDFEASRNRLLAGSATEPDGAIQQQHYRTFAKEGQLR